MLNLWRVHSHLTTEEKSVRAELPEQRRQGAFPVLGSVVLHYGLSISSVICVGILGRLQ